LLYISVSYHSKLAASSDASETDYVLEELRCLRSTGFPWRGLLTDFAATHDANEIRDAILNPSGAEGTGQTAAAVTTIAGDRFSGLIRNESNSSIQIQDAEGRFYLFVKSSLRSIERSANYQQELSTKEIEDLVSYIVYQTSSPEVAGGHSTRRPKAQIE
jgi:hypothetical protein